MGSFSWQGKGTPVYSLHAGAEEHRGDEFLESRKAKQTRQQAPEDGFLKALVHGGDLTRDGGAVQHLELSGAATAGVRLILKTRNSARAS